MATKEIPRAEWVRWLDVFSKQHAGWLVTVELLGSHLGDQEQSTRLPLVGVSADVKDKEHGIVVILGGRPGAHLTRIIEKAKRLWLKDPEDTVNEALAVESEDGTATVVNFQRVPPTQAERQLPGGAPGRG